MVGDTTRRGTPRTQIGTGVDWRIWFLSDGCSDAGHHELHGWRTQAMFRRYGIVDNADKLMAPEQEGTYVREQLKKQGPK